MIWAWIGLCTLLATLLLLKRKEMATLQSMLAGGRIPVGCIVAESVVILLLALVVLAAWRAGLLE